MKEFETIVTHSGRNPKKNSGVVNQPVIRASTILFDSYEDFKNASLGKFKGTAYGRHGTEAHRLLESALGELEGADKTLLCNSGVSAISCALLALLKAGDHLLVTDSVYYPTRDFCDNELKRLGVEVTYYDPLIGSGIKKLFRKNTKLVFVETPSSLTFEVQDVPAIAAEAHKIGAAVVADNTWATPIFYKAFERGVDVSIHSATKFIGGHSDLLMGVINSREKFYPAIKRTYKNLGICSSADDVYLAARGLRTLAVRLKAHEASGLHIAKWLKEKSYVTKILHPAFADCPNHKIWKRDFAGSSGLFSVILKKSLSEKELAKFFDTLELFKLGYSYGGFESLIIPVKPPRSARKWEENNTTLRLFCGLENVSDLKADLHRAFSFVL